jgi:hypothetical protein
MIVSATNHIKVLFGMQNVKRRLQQIYSASTDDERASWRHLHIDKKQKHTGYYTKPTQNPRITY